MTAGPSVPAATGMVHAQLNKNNGNTQLEIKVDNLAQPSSLNPPASAYVVWVRPNNGAALREGAIGVNHGLNGELHVVTALKKFEVFITPEENKTPAFPSDREVLRAHVNMG